MYLRRGISGLRVGWMHTLNTDLIGAFDSLAYFAMPSTIIQEAATQMLLDRAFVDSYLKENQRRLARSYDALIGMEWCRAHIMPLSAAMQSRSSGLLTSLIARECCCNVMRRGDGRVVCRFPPTETESKATVRMQAALTLDSLHTEPLTIHEDWRQNGPINTALLCR